MLSKGGKVYFFHIMFHCTIFCFFICIYCCFYVRHIVIIQRPFILHGIIQSLLHFKCQINLLTLDHEQVYMAYLIWSFCFEAALFICSKNVWKFPRQIFFVNFSYSASYYLFGLYYQLLCCSCLAFKGKPRHVDESIHIGRNWYFFHNIVISIYNVLGLNGIKKMKNISLLLFHFQLKIFHQRERYLQNCKFLLFSYIFKKKYKRC